jgi:glutamine---fructose-6-phosphate transaminase (isomerizing)
MNIGGRERTGSSMCGFIGYVGQRRCQDLLYQALRRLEYQGHDSAGVAWLEEGRTTCVRAVGSLERLGAALLGHSGESSAAGPAFAAGPVLAVADRASTGIGHTRWATHSGMSGRIRVVLNGLIENHISLHKHLVGEKVEWTSETDAEAVAHLLALNYDGDLARAVQGALPDLTGHYAFVAMCESEPDTLVAVRRDCPLIVGVGSGEQFVASSIAACYPYTRDVVALKNGEVVLLRPDGVEVLEPDGVLSRPVATTVGWTEDGAEKGEFETRMLKEVHEQPRAVAETLSHWQAQAASMADGVLSSRFLRDVARIVIIGSHASYHAGLAGRLAIERWTGVPAGVEIASDFVYREPILPMGTLVLAISGSGEIADTIAAMRLARERGARVVALTNVLGSRATCESDGALLTLAGLEVGVAATKSFVTQVAVLQAFALCLAEVASTISRTRVAELSSGLEKLPAQIGTALSSYARVDAIAERLAWSPFVLLQADPSGLPAAMEGALKLREISRIPTDVYPAGGMEHGPTSLLNAQTPVVCVATEDRVLPKLLSNLREARARGAPVIAVTPTGCRELSEHAEAVIYVPRTDPVLQVASAVIPLQLLAYCVARHRGFAVDQPRSLAATATAEQ